MALQNLPDELLLQIVQYSIPEGYEALVLSCRNIWRVGPDFSKAIIVSAEDIETSHTMQ